jgi:hypothetical protein
MHKGGIASGVARAWRGRRRVVCAVLAGLFVTGYALVDENLTATADRGGATITRAEVLTRAENWFKQRAQIPYNQGGKFPDEEGQAYRTDCSGFVSMAWHLTSQVNTRSLPSIAHVIAKSDLQTGDVLDAAQGAGNYDTGHVVLFVRWTSPAETSYVGLEFGGTPIEDHVIPYPYFKSDPRTYVPYRYNHIVNDDGTASAPVVAAPKNSSVAFYTPTSGQLRVLRNGTAAPVSPSLAGTPWRDSSVQFLAGDWNGDGATEIGWYDHRDGTFHLRTSTGANAPVNVFAAGPRADAGIAPIAGDWTGDGVDTVGWYQPSDGTFHLLARNAAGAPTSLFSGAPSGDTSVQVLAGDWTGSHHDTVGWYRPGDGVFHLLQFDVTGSPTIDVTGAPTGDPTVVAVAGDWHGTGVDGVGWYRPTGGTLELVDNPRAPQWTRRQQPAVNGAGVRLVVGRFTVGS